jgi:SAM-dependent methyltransferase
MHPEIDVFVASVKKKYPEFFEGKSVLEVGSQNINGTVRTHFKNCHYIGTDLGEAPGVDVVHDITEGTLNNMQFDVVISSEMLEHCEKWESALINMYHSTKPGGLFILTCAGPQRQEHGTHSHTPQDSVFTLDHYKNISVKMFDSILPGIFFDAHELGYSRGEADLYFWGIRNGE